MTLAVPIDLRKGLPTTDLRLTDYTIKYFHPTIPLPNFKDKTVFDLTQLVEELSWDYDREQAARHATLKFTHHPNLKDIVGVGGIIQVFGYAVQPDSLTFDEILRLHIIDTNLETEQNAPAAPMSIECYDSMWYLVNNETTAVYRQMKASEIILAICKDFGIPVGTVEDTGAVIPRLFFRKSNLYDMMITALTESRYIDGQRYIIRMEKGLLNVKKKVLPPKVFVLAYGDNLYSAGLSKSLKEMKNRIKLYSEGPAGSSLTGIIDQSTGQNTGDLPILQATADDAFMQQFYGLLQTIDTNASPDRFTNEQEYAKHILLMKSRVKFEGKVTGPNINTLMWGDALFCYEPLTGLVGQYYVVSGRHTVTKEGSEMDLIIHFWDQLPEQFFETYDTLGAKGTLDNILRYAGLTGAGDGTKFFPPVLGVYPITQEFGANPNNGTNGPTGHTGIDIACPDDTLVLAMGEGTVTQAGPGGGDNLAGTWVKIDHGLGIESVYAHLDSVLFEIKVGTRVKRTQQIANSGHSGAATGPHLHFEIRLNGRPVDPRNYVLFGAVATLNSPQLSGLVSLDQLAVWARKYGADPYLVQSAAWQESGLEIGRKGDAGDAVKFPARSKVGNGYCSFGLFQENICDPTAAGSQYIDGAIDGKKHTIDELLEPEGQVARFAVRLKNVQNPGNLSPGQLAALAQRPANEIGYANDVDANYVKFKAQDTNT